MGSDIVMCFLGFPTHDPSPLARELERKAGQLSRTFHEAHHRLHRSVRDLHDATDLALEEDAAGAEQALGRCLDGFRQVASDLTQMHATLLQIRGGLESADRDDADPFLLRDRQLVHLERGKVARALARRSLDAGNDPAYHQVMDALLDGGTIAATRLVERQVRRMQTELQDFVSRTHAIPTRPLTEFAKRNHSRGLDALAMCLPWNRFASLCAYLNFVCEQATELELATGDQEAVRQEIA